MKTKLSPGAQAVLDAQLRRRIVGAPPAPHDALAHTINQALAHPRGWQPITLTRDDQQLGGIIVVRDVNVFEKIVALIDGRCHRADDALLTSGALTTEGENAS